MIGSPVRRFLFRLSLVQGVVETCSPGVDSGFRVCYTALMDDVIYLQGRHIGASELTTIRSLLAEPGVNRTRVSVALCERWDWRTETGQLKDFAARTLLRKLEARGLITLPPARKGRQVQRHPAPDTVTWDRSPIIGQLADLAPVSVHLVTTRAQRTLLYALFERDHYLSFRTPVGASAGHLFYSAAGRLLGGSLIGSSAWRCTARDLPIQ